MERRSSIAGSDGAASTPAGVLPTATNRRPALPCPYAMLPGGARSTTLARVKRATTPPRTMRDARHGVIGR
eukprot:1988713-Lingulodinium_polyedra.AAC.1